ncbi:MAG: hypothetical protein HY080_07295 [Gammaproteobacteria bacterium]|nr:hypothetical protein [Gammaproteobacteria bacterium]
MKRSIAVTAMSLFSIANLAAGITLTLKKTLKKLGLGSLIATFSFFFIGADAIAGTWTAPYTVATVHSGHDAASFYIITAEHNTTSCGSNNMWQFITSDTSDGRYSL